MQANIVLLPGDGIGPEVAAGRTYELVEGRDELREIVTERFSLAR